MQQVMLIWIPTLGGGGLIRHIAVSLPRIDQLLDGQKYLDPADMKPPQDMSEPPQDAPRHRGPRKRGFEFKTRRAPSLRALVRLAQACDSAEELGKKLRRRYDRSLRRQGIDPRAKRQARAEAELDRLLQD
jgi:hypothetical protein